MQIPVLIEPLTRNGFRARAPFGFSASGATREAAMTKLRAKIEARLKKGAEIVELDIDEHPDRA